MCECDEVEVEFTDDELRGMLSDDSLIIRDYAQFELAVRAGMVDWLKFRGPVRTSLPSGAWRKLNQGEPAS